MRKILDGTRSTKILLLAAESLNYLHGITEATKLGELENACVVEINNIRTGVLVEQCLEYLTGNTGVLIEVAFFLDIICSF